MNIRKIENEKEWSEFVLEHGPRSGAFLHSWSWGELQEAIGHRLWRFGMFDGEKLIGVFSLNKHTFPFGRSYLYSPRGPIFMEGHTHLIDEFIDYAKDIGLEENAVFIRFEPANESTESLKGRGICDSEDLQPKDTIMVDLSRSDENLLKAMHSKTRYNVRLAEKKGVSLEMVGEEGIDEFWPLLVDTYKRQGINPHPKKLLRSYSQTSFK